MCNRSCTPTSACNGPLHGEVNGVDYCLGVLSHMCLVNATCCYIALVQRMLKNVVDIGECSTDLEKIGKRLIQEDTHKKRSRECM